MRRNSKVRLIAYFFLGFLCLNSAVHAELAFKSKHGFKVYNPEDPDYWFKINTHLKFDETLFSGSASAKQRGFPSGGNIRTLELALCGGLKNHLSYRIKINFENGPHFWDTYLAYKPNNDITLAFGQVPLPYSFENTCSSKWSSFMERPLPIAAFCPCYGLGVFGNFTVWDMLAMTMTITGPPQLRDPIFSRDLLNVASRVTFSPVHTAHTVYHLGIFARYETVENHFSPQFKTRPEAKTKGTAFVINTGRIRNTHNLIVFGPDAALMCGPLTLQGELVYAHVNRSSVTPGDLRFKGWYVQAAYFLTGESRRYNFTYGTFGRVHPIAATGAWEIAFRHSYVNLNHKDIQGGSEHNTSASLGWYANDNVRIFGNYIRAHLRPGSRDKVALRPLDIFGIRFQYVY